MYGVYRRYPYPYSRPPLTAFSVKQGVTWDTVWSTNHAAFSNGNLTATISPIGGAIRCTTFNDTTARYFEVLCTVVAGAAFDVGLAYSDLPNTNPISGDGVAYRVDGTVNYDGTSEFTGDTYTSGDIIGVFIDESIKAYFSKNGTWQNGANPSARTGGLDVSRFFPSFLFYPAVFCNPSGPSSVVTANFGASSFAYSIPTGGYSWDGSQLGVGATRRQAARFAYFTI